MPSPDQVNEHDRPALEDTRLPGLSADGLEASAKDITEDTELAATQSIVDTLASGSESMFQPGAFIKHYQLIRELGHGGMGTVFLARDTKLGRRVAIKFITTHDDRLTQRFIAEARATARCNHENIVVIYEVEEYRGHPYMVLEYVPGKTLKEWLDARVPEDAPIKPERRSFKTRPPVAVARVIELMLPVARALALAHEMGIVHRDLKPANIMLTDAGGLKVLDFGLAKLQAEAKTSSPMTNPGCDPTQDQGQVFDNLTRTGAFMGTVAYMSPEQWHGADVDHRSDLWAVGIMLFEMVAGHHPLAPISAERLRSVPYLEHAMPRASELGHAGKLGPIIDRCLLKRKQDRMVGARELVRELEALRSSGRGSMHERDNPFTGLSAFQKSDADRFFGRDNDIECALERLRAQPLVALVAPSGAGKSSLVRAGVIPALERSGEGWESYIIRPGRQPLTSLANVLAAWSSAAWSSSSSSASGVSAHATAPIELAALERREFDVPELADKLRAEPGFLGTALRTRAQRKLRRIVLFVDQFEELYTLCPDPDERTAFANCLAGVADDASSPLRVILSMRSDFFDRVVADREFMNAVTRGLMFLPPMGRDGLRAALVQPLEAAGYTFESVAMIEDMLDTLAHTPGALPLLQFTAAKLWESRDRQARLLTEACYHEIGGIEGTLASHADAVLAAMSSREQRLARQVIERLVTPEHTRAVVSVSELEEMFPGQEDEFRQVIEYLAGARLLVIETQHQAPNQVGGVSSVSSVPNAEDVEDASYTVELVHESLIARWPTLRRWLDENTEDAAFLDRLRAATRQWQASERSAGALWRDEAMHEARRFCVRYRGKTLPTREQAYLDAVFALARRTTRRRTMLIGSVIAIFAVVAAVMTSLAWREARSSARAAHETERAEHEAERAAEQAVLAGREAERARDASRMAVARELGDDSTLALALLREVVDREHTYAWDPQTRLALQRGVAQEVLHRGQDTIYTMAHTKSGWLVVSTGTDGQAHVWGAQGFDQPLDRAAYQQVIERASLSPDREHLVTVDTHEQAHLWRIDLAHDRVTHERTLEGHTDRLWGAHFSPDGTRIVTISQDQTARVWATAGDRPPVVLRGHQGWVMDAQFTPNGERLVTASFDRTARVWNADGSGQPIVLSGHEDRINALALSPDGKRVVTASFDRTARVWNLDGSGQPIVLKGHKDWVMQAAFSPDGDQVATASFDKSARVWHLAKPRGADGSVPFHELRGHEDWIVHLAFSPDARFLATVSKDGTARVWPAQNWLDNGGREPFVLRHTGPVTMAVFSPDSRQLATYSNDSTARIWDLDALARRPIILSRDGGFTVLFSPDGARLLATFVSGKIRIWQARGDDHHLIAEIQAHTDEASGISFSPDGTRFATSSYDGLVHVWRADGTGPLLTMRGHTQPVSSVDFSPDGRRLVTASQDHSARIWDATSGAQLAVLDGHSEWVTWAQFSPDGRFIATSSQDKDARIWNPDTPDTSVAVLRGHTDRLWKAVYSPDGRYLATVSADHTARVWLMDKESGQPKGEPVILRGHTDLVVSAAFDSRSTRLITTSADSTVRIWNLRAPGEAIVLTGYRDQIESAVFSPDDRHIAITGYEEGVRIMPTPPERLSDALLWSATDYCMPVSTRQELLGVDQDVATRTFDNCRERVRAHAPPSR